MDVIGDYSEPPVQPDSFHIFFYADSGTLPGTLVASRLANPYSGFIDFVITLTSPVTLTEGAYWVSVQAREDFSTAGQWFWDNRLVTSNAGAVWQNRGGGFGAGCLTWGRKTSCLPNSKWAGPTIPARWDDRQRYSSAYGDSDTRYGLLRQQGPRPTPAPRPTP